MAFLLTEDNQSSLTPPGLTAESRGSSVFDLPTHISSSTRLERRPTQLPEVSHHPTSTNSTKSAPRFIVVSGGTGGNSICSAFGNACYVLPVSDDGGSSSEIIRVLGGPSIGAHRILKPCLPSAERSLQVTYGLDW
jgi:hypothetical protein